MLKMENKMITEGLTLEYNIKLAEAQKDPDKFFKRLKEEEKKGEQALLWNSSPWKDYDSIEDYLESQNFKYSEEYTFWYKKPQDLIDATSKLIELVKSGEVKDFLIIPLYIASYGKGGYGGNPNIHGVYIKSQKEKSSDK